MPEILNYSTCPIRELGYFSRRPPGMSGGYSIPRFGLEIELCGYDEDEHEQVDRWWRQLPTALKKDSFASGYCIAAEDGSLDGESPAELKTPPFSKREHELVHQERWFESAYAWTKSCCGIHITVDRWLASKATWSKVAYWINHLSDENLNTLFLRAPNSYCCPDSRTTIHSVAHIDRRQEGHSDKYESLHLKGRLVEFRGFRSSVNPKTILRHIDVVESLIPFMRDTPFCQLEGTTLEHYGAWLRRTPGHFPHLTAWLRNRASDSPLRHSFLS